MIAATGAGTMIDNRETMTTTYWVESGTGERLSENSDYATSNALARRLRERLVREVRDTDGDLLDDELVVDYGCL